MFCRWAVQEAKDIGVREAYRSYMADLVKAMAERKTVSRRWQDVIEPMADFDADEIADDIAGRIAGD